MHTAQNSEKQKELILSMYVMSYRVRKICSYDSDKSCENCDGVRQNI